MKVHIKAIGLKATPSLQTYIEEKLGSLDRFLQRFEEKGSLEMWVEVARTTKHHHKGEVYQVKADIVLPGHVLRAEHTSSDPRGAIDLVRNTLLIEIKRHKEKHIDERRTAKSK